MYGLDSLYIWRGVLVLRTWSFSKVAALRKDSLESEIVGAVGSEEVRRSK